MTADERTLRLEAQVESLTQRVYRLESRVAPAGHAAPGPAAPAAEPSLPAAPDERPPVFQSPGWAVPAAPPAASPRSMRPAATLTPSRLLAVAGGLVLLLGLGFLLRYAVIQGWLGPATRVVIGLAGSAVLARIGIHLERSCDTRLVGQICTATASAGGYAAVVAATVLYHFVPAGVGLVAAAGIAGAAIARGAWTRTQGITALGMGGALLSPVLVDADNGAATLGLLTVALAAGLYVSVRQQWPLVMGLAFILISPQLWVIAVDRAPVVVGLLFAVLCGGLLLLAGAIAARAGDGPDTAVPIGVVALNALSIAGLGATVLQSRLAHVDVAVGLWLLAVGAVHLIVGLQLARRFFAPPIAVVVIVVGVVLCDAAVLDLADGYAATVLLGTIGTAGAVALHRSWLHLTGRLVVVLQLVGVALHVGSVAIGRAPLGSAEAVLFVTAACGAAVAFAALVPDADRDLAAIGAATLLGLGAARLLLFEAPLSSLLAGPRDLPVAFIMCTVLAAAGLLLGELLHRAFAVAAVAVGNYGLSLAAVALDPDGLGRVALTALWSGGGAIALVAGRRLARPDVRRAGGALLLAAVTKAALVDTILLDGTARAAALLLCGSVLVTTAVAEARAAGRSEALSTP